MHFKILVVFGFILYIHNKMTLFSKWSIFCFFSKPSTVQSEKNIILLRLYIEIDRMIDKDLEVCIYKFNNF